MPDHTNPKKDQSGNALQCHEFDGLLSDALDGILTGLQLDRFQAHARVCSACGPLFAEVEAGRDWLKGLTEVEPPAGLFTNILASTTGVDTQRLHANAPASRTRVSRLERAQAWISQTVSGILEPVWATVRQPRFVMSFGMAFFSLSVALSAIGVRPADLRQVSLRPAALRHTYYSTQARVVRYYENIRFVYEVESRVREIKRTITPAEPAPAESGPDKPKERKNDTSKEPEQKQERNYSQTDSSIILASAPLGPSALHDGEDDLPVVSVTTYRRFV
ncbi:MAG: zf-HC2 domain-containing protein [Candidatus Sulfotelmatobacter sp.]